MVRCVPSTRRHRNLVCVVDSSGYLSGCLAVLALIAILVTTWAVSCSLLLLWSQPVNHSITQSSGPSGDDLSQHNLNNKRARPCHAMPSMGAWAFAAHQPGLHHRRS